MRADSEFRGVLVAQGCAEATAAQYASAVASALRSMTTPQDAEGLQSFLTSLAPTSLRASLAAWHKWRTLHPEFVEPLDLASSEPYRYAADVLAALEVVADTLRVAASKVAACRWGDVRADAQGVKIRMLRYGIDGAHALARGAWAALTLLHTEVVGETAHVTDACLLPVTPVDLTHPMPRRALAALFRDTERRSAYDRIRKLTGEVQPWMSV